MKACDAGQVFTPAPVALAVVALLIQAMAVPPPVQAARPSERELSHVLRQASHIRLWTRAGAIELRKVRIDDGGLAFEAFERTTHTSPVAVPGRVQWAELDSIEIQGAGRTSRWVLASRWAGSFTAAQISPLVSG